VLSKRFPLDFYAKGGRFLIPKTCPEAVPPIFGFFYTSLPAFNAGARMWRLCGRLSSFFEDSKTIVGPCGILGGRKSSLNLPRRYCGLIFFFFLEILWSLRTVRCGAGYISSGYSVGF